MERLNRGCLACAILTSSDRSALLIYRHKKNQQSQERKKHGASWSRNVPLKLIKELRMLLDGATSLSVLVRILLSGLKPVLPWATLGLLDFRLQI